MKQLMENWRGFLREQSIDVGTITGKSLLKFRIEKRLPDEKKSKKTLDAEKDKGEK